MNTVQEFFEQDLYAPAGYITKQAFDAAGVPVHQWRTLADDAKQEAIVGFLEAQHSARTRTGVWRMGYWQVLEWIWTYLREDRSKRVDAWRETGRIVHLEIPVTLRDHSGDPEAMLIEQEQQEERRAIIDSVARLLEHIFVSARKRGGERTAKAAARDVQIIMLSLQGYSNEGIAHELSISTSDVRAYLSRARKYLESYLESL